MGEMHPTGTNPDQRQVFHAFIPLENLMRHTRQRPRNIARIHNQPLLLTIHYRSHHF